MSPKKDGLMAYVSSEKEKPVDLEHLSTMTMGDESLGNELLAVFAAQVAEYLKLAEACSGENETRRVAHTIKGSANSIGAFRLAKLLQQSEETGQLDVAVLKVELAAVTDYVDSLR